MEDRKILNFGDVFKISEPHMLFWFLNERKSQKPFGYLCKKGSVKSVKSKKSSNFKKISGKFKHKRIRLLYFLFTIYPYLPRVLYLISPSSTLHLSLIFLSQEDALLRNKIVSSFSCKLHHSVHILYYSTLLLYLSEM